MRDEYDTEPPQELLENSPQEWIDDENTCSVCGFSTEDVEEMVGHLLEGCDQ